MKIQKVRTKSVNDDGCGRVSLRYVMAQRFKKHGYTHVQVDGVVYNTSIISNIVWIDK